MLVLYKIKYFYKREHRTGSGNGRTMTGSGKREREFKNGNPCVYVLGSAALKEFQVFVLLGSLQDPAFTTSFMSQVMPGYLVLG
jgi:hypothetical protein